MSILNPHESRIAARSRAYDNSQDEREALAEIDRQVFDAVARFERGVIDTARAHANKGDDLARQAVTLEAELRTRFRDAAHNGQVDRDLLREFSRLRSRAEAVADALDVAERSTAWHIGRLSDIYGSWLALVAKYPTLRPALRVQ